MPLSPCWKVSVGHLFEAFQSCVELQRERFDCLPKYGLNLFVPLHANDQRWIGRAITQEHPPRSTRDKHRKMYLAKVFWRDSSIEEILDLRRRTWPFDFRASILTD